MASIFFIRCALSLVQAQLRARAPALFCFPTDGPPLDWSAALSSANATVLKWIHDNQQLAD
jgi:hypothetical protein